jgi:hypothetical protein
MIDVYMAVQAMRCVARCMAWFCHLLLLQFNFTSHASCWQQEERTKRRLAGK